MNKGVIIGAVVAVAVLAAGGLVISSLFQPVERELVSSAPAQLQSSMESTASTERTAPESSSLPETDPFVGAPIPQNEDMADSSWLDDAIFIGDSLTYGLSSYQILPEEQVLAHTGINPQTILTSECIETANGTKTVLDALAEKSPGKIYIMLGANGVGFLSSENIVENYGQLIDGIRELLPDVPIYVQSILPVTAEKSSDSRYANSKIDQYNADIAQMAADKEVYYLNVAEALKDENGNLPTELSGDGMHFGPSTYEKWLEYLRCHRAE